jgi:[acyl-carrier-protein] S-malonyltransferase
MGADLFESVPELLGVESDEILGFNLRHTCLEGPEELLTRTDRAQPALYALAYALWHLLELELEGSTPAGAAGHSLGEYTAHAAAGTYDFQTGLRLVATRGRAMRAAGDGSDGTMAAVIGIDAGGAEKAAAARRDAGGSLWVANINAPGQVVVSGGEDDIAWLSEAVADFGGRRVMPLRVGGAFHSPFMQPARETLAAALREASPGMSSPSFPVFTNLTARPSVDPVSELGEQMVAPVRFAESLTNMAAAGIEVFVHVGPGDVTAGLVKRTLPDAEVHIASTAAAAKSVASRLAARIN